MRVVLTGASGQLGPYLAARLLAGGHAVTAWSGSATGERAGLPLLPVDLTDPAAVSRALDESDADLVLHAAAVSTGDGVRRDPARARGVNVVATGLIAAWCAWHRRRLVFTSTDLVFDGSKAWNHETDETGPVLAYGRTKLDAEGLALGAPGAVVARLCLLYGPGRDGRETYLDRALAALGRGEPQTFFGDEYRTPLDFTTAADLLVRVAESRFSGLIHVAGAERVSRHDLVRRVAAAVGLDPGLVLAESRADATFAEPRPADVSLDTTRLAAVLPGLRRPTIEQAAAAFAR